MMRQLAALLVVVGFISMGAAMFYGPKLFVLGLAIETVGYFVWPSRRLEEKDGSKEPGVT